LRARELAIETAGLAKSFGALRVLKGIDLRVPIGSVYALLGPNGAGKTTTVRILATLSRADEGEIRVAGVDVRRDRGRVRRAISLTGQHVSIDDAQTAEENLRMIARLSGMSRADARRRPQELLRIFDLSGHAHRRVAACSVGMRRRLDLAASLVGRPPVVFLDEPTTGLDIPSRLAMWSVIGELAGGGVTIFLTTQYLEEADRLADRVAVLDRGVIVAEGTPAALKQRVGGQRLDLTVVDREAYTRVAGILDGRAVRTDPVGLTIGVATDGHARGVRNLLDEVDPLRSDVRAFAIRGVTLDDVFLALTGDGADRGRREEARV
jgi:ABC-2 type transport system ATP-binding protein